MSFKIIYEPSGRAKEYGDLALNIYIGCSFGCIYCFAPNVLKKDRKEFHEAVKVRDRILEKLESDCQMNLLEGRKVHACFTCDPYQDIDIELQTTREVLKMFKKYNINFQILTKGGMRAMRDFDLYKSGDSFGTTLTMLPMNQYQEFWEPKAAEPSSRFEAMFIAHDKGIKTWASLEPVIYPDEALEIIRITHPYTDLFKVGKMNSDNCKGSKEYRVIRDVEQGINWKEFGHKAVKLLESLGKDYYIKDDLRKEMEK
jgi:DNA repair photolyase